MERVTMAHVVKIHLEPSSILGSPEAHELAHRLFEVVRRARRELEAAPVRL